MEIGRTPAIAPGAVANTTNGNKVQPVQTILPQYQTVTQAGQSESVSLTFREVPTQTSAENSQATREPSGDILEQQKSLLRKEIEIDRDASVVIFRAVDVTTGDVVRQYPEEARLKLSAYIEKIIK